MSSKHGFLGSSPSSDGVRSAKGTPETRLTPFSSVKSVNDKAAFIFSSNTVNPASMKVIIPQHGLGPMDKDPFVSTSSKPPCEQSVLSPTASAFQPFSLRISQGLAQTPLVVNSQGHSATLHATNQSVQASVTPSKGESASPADSHSSAVTQSGTFSTDLGSITRSLEVSGIYHPVQVTRLQATVQNTCTNSKGSLKFFRIGGNVLLRFSDIADAINVYNNLKGNHLEWAVEFITPAIFSEKTTPGSQFVSAHEGQISLIATFPPSGGFDRAKLEVIILDLLSVDGVVYAYQKQLATEAGTLRLIAEYSDVNSAISAVERLNGATVRGINLSVSFHVPDIGASPRHRGHPRTPTHGGLNHGELTGALTRMSVTSPAVMNGSIVSSGYTSVLSPTGRSFVPTSYTLSPGMSPVPLAYGYQFSPVNSAFLSFTPPASQCNHFGANDSNSNGVATQMGGLDGVCSPVQGLSRGTSLARFNSKRQNAPRVGNCSSYASSPVGQHNVVDIDRIRAGLDVRTTIMLRNIPNKIDQGLLKAIVDQTSRGLYDFMYLRIDFANNCNVGYAFINFEDPYHIIGFVTARAGQRWNRYSSDKIAEVSYATIQGRDCLVQKFRNSSVMLEHPSFRPKVSKGTWFCDLTTLAHTMRIFFTGNDPRAGEEEDFPLPDNASKMRRSVENAEHVGLFAPRAGQHYRDEQRRRRSRYDRGTRLAALEEYDYEECYSMDQSSQGPYTC